MTVYYAGRLLQLAGLIIVAETLIMFFGRMMPLLQGSLAGVLVFYLGYFLVRKFSALNQVFLVRKKKQSTLASAVS